MTDEAYEAHNTATSPTTAEDHDPLSQRRPDPPENELSHLTRQLTECQQRSAATFQEFAELGEFFRTHYGAEIARGHATGERTCDTIMRLLTVERWVSKTTPVRWLYRIMDGSGWRR